MGEWKDYSLSEIAHYTTGKLNSNAEEEHGRYPFFTCSPVTLKIDSYAFDTESLILAGNNANGIFSLKYFNGKFNAYQRTYVITINDQSIADYKFLFYSLKTQLSTLETISHGTATKYLTLPILNQIPIKLPPLSEQKAIASVLSGLDDKIDLLHRQNKTLEAMAETLFRQWFIEEAGDDWKDGCLGDLIILNYGKSLTKKNRTGFGYPVVGSNKIVDYHSEYLVEAPGIVIGRKGTLGKTIYLSDNFYPSIPSPKCILVVFLQKSHFEND